MTAKACRETWEDLLINHNTNISRKKFKLRKEDINFITSFTMPEMFVDSELNKVYKNRSKELEEEFIALEEAYKKKRTQVRVYQFMSCIYALIVFPIIIILGYLVYS